MRILAIETSCDETGVAVLQAERSGDGVSFTVLGQALFSQASLHAAYGGVYPTLAKREHEKNLPVMLEQALEQSGLSPENLDAIAVTHGPGLEPALWSGIVFAQELAKKWQKPLFPTNHMEGHLISSLVQGGALEDVRFPVMGLLVSGGHTELVLMKNWFTYELVGETLDDAAGEAFDKVARMLGLAYPGGPEISKLARKAREQGIVSDIKLPRPMLQSGNCDVSFSGLKTAALYALRDKGGIHRLSTDETISFAREFEDAVVEVLIAKVRRALDESGAHTFVIGGGVAANSHLRDSLVEMLANEFPDTEVRLPELSITGDNAVMIAEAALTHLVMGDWTLGSAPPDIRAIGNLSLETGKTAGK